MADVVDVACVKAEDRTCPVRRRMEGEGVTARRQVVLQETALDDAHRPVDPRGGVEHGARLFDQPQCLHRPEVYGGIGESEAAALLRAFFARRR